MIIRKMKIPALFIGITLMTSTLISCGSSEGDSKVNNSTNSEIEVYAKEDIAEQYLNIKKALVASDADSAQIAAKALLLSLENKSEKWAEDMKKPVKVISDTLMLEVQRTHFKLLSDQLIVLAKESNDFGISLYEQYCPMAFGNEGASWLSDNKEVLNPYYGDQMLKCGINKGTIPQN